MFFESCWNIEVVSFCCSSLGGQLRISEDDRSTFVIAYSIHNRGEGFVQRKGYDLFCLICTWFSSAPVNWKQTKRAKEQTHAAPLPHRTQNTIPTPTHRPPRKQSRPRHLHRIPRNRRTPGHRHRNHPQMPQTSRSRRRQHRRYQHRHGSRKQAPSQRKRRTQTNQRNPTHRVGVFRSRTAPPSPIMIPYIDRYRDRFGVENICTVLKKNVFDRG